MNVLLEIGLLLIIGYVAGWLLNLIGLPKVIGYIATGIIFSPATLPFISYDFVTQTEPIMEVCMAFIALKLAGLLNGRGLKGMKGKSSISPYGLVCFLS